MFDQITVVAILRIVCNAYLYSCVALMGFSYLGYVVFNQLEKSQKRQQQTHPFS